MKWEQSLFNQAIDGCVKPNVSFPLKPTPLSRATGQERGVGWRADWRLASPPSPTVSSSNQPDTKEAASDNTNSTMIGSDGSQSAAKSGGVIIDCFFLFASADRRGGGIVIGGRWGGGITGVRRRCPNKSTWKYTKQIQSDLLEEREGNFHTYNNDCEVIDWLTTKKSGQTCKVGESRDGGNETAEHLSTEKQEKQSSTKPWRSG